MHISQIIEAFENQQLSSVALCTEYLDKIEKENADLGAVLYFNKEQVLKAAEQSDLRRSAGEILSELDGIPIIVKDNISVKDMPCTAGSKILEGYIAPYDATVIARLKAAGMIVLAKSNMDEFGMGSSTEKSAYQKCLNPLNSEYVPGGSSGGSAAAIAANWAPVALGSDTGGSIRQPAEFCSLVGYKPSYAQVSRFGLLAYASSLDQIGPMAHNVLDCAYIFEKMHGPDARDSTCDQSSHPKTDVKIVQMLQKLALNKEKMNLQGVKVGIVKENYDQAIACESLKAAMQQAQSTLEQLGAQIQEISIPSSKYAVPTYYLLATAEAASNLNRYDGVRFGPRKGAEKGLANMYTQTRGELFGKEVKKRILLGNFVLSSGFYDAYYIGAQKVRALIAQEYAAAFEQVDLVLSPVSPDGAFKFGEKSKNPLEMYQSDMYTVLANLAGLCALSLPVSKTKGDLSTSVQLMAAKGDDVDLIKSAHIFEQGLVSA